MPAVSCVPATGNLLNANIDTPRTVRYGNDPVPAPPSFTIDTADLRALRLTVGGDCPFQ